jgi:hypothetical protein
VCCFGRLICFRPRQRKEKQKSIFFDRIPGGLTRNASNHTHAIITVQALLALFATEALADGEIQVRM